MSSASLVLWKEPDCSLNQLRGIPLLNLKKLIPADKFFDFFIPLDIDGVKYIMTYCVRNHQHNYFEIYGAPARGAEWNPGVNGPAEALAADLLTNNITVSHCICIFSEIETDSIFDPSKFLLVWARSERVSLRASDWLKKCYNEST